MLQILCAEFGKVGFELFFSKTKVFTTQEMNVVDVVIVNDELIDVMKNNCIHKCLGRKYKGDLTKCRRIGFQHRVNLVWAEFGHYRTLSQNMCK